MCSYINVGTLFNSSGSQQFQQLPFVWLADSYPSRKHLVQARNLLFGFKFQISNSKLWKLGLAVKKLQFMYTHTVLVRFAWSEQCTAITSL